MTDPLGEVRFTRVKQGYAPAEVEAVITRARALLAVRGEHDGEDTPLSLLERAQTVADEEVRAATMKGEAITSAARKQAEEMLAEARKGAERILADAQVESDRLRGDAEHLRVERDEVAEAARELAGRLRAAADWAQGH